MTAVTYPAARRQSGHQTVSDSRSLPADRGVFHFAALLFGMGDVSHMSNGYPIGTWVVLDVVIGTAFGCGGFAMALLVYIFNRNVYHPLMRPALLGGVFGYTLAGLAVMIDLGRYWNAFNLLLPWYAQPNSVILEVGLCHGLHHGAVAGVLAGVSGADAGKLQATVWPGQAPGFPEKYMYVLIAIGVLLPTMHQSSLGSVLLIMGSKLSPLWATIWLPLLFLISALAMGCGVVMLEATLVNRAFKTPSEARLFARLARVVAGLLAGYLLLRWGDLAYRGYLGLAFAGDWDGNLFLIETALFLVPLFVLVSHRRTRQRWQFLAAVSLLAGGSLYRLNAYLMAVRPGNGWTYFPSAPELMITIGVICLEIMLYLLFIKTLPVLHGAHQAQP